MENCATVHVEIDSIEKIGSGKVGSYLWTQESGFGIRKGFLNN
jgi:hypothetical protein